MDLKIHLPRELTYVLSNYRLRTETVGELLHAEMSMHTKEMETKVSGYMKYDRGTLANEITLGDVDDDAVEVEANGIDGSVYIYFQESYFSGCRSMDDHPDHEHQVPFTLDLAKGLLTMQFYDKPEPDPDTY